MPNVSNSIGRAFNRFGAAQPIALNISNTFAGLPHKLKSYGILGQVFGHISHFLSNIRFGVVLNEKFLQKYSTNALVPQGSILGSNIFLLDINYLFDDAICNIVIYADDTTFYSKCDQASDLWQQVALDSGFKSELRESKS